MLTQKQLIINYITDFGSITPLDAFYDLGITKLATRVSELKREGYRFVTESVTSKNRYGKSVTYSRYRLGDNT